ncbi:MAG: hypothetical protein LBF08_08525 [Dysgonamonadaceae bacterium]|nr:hypothetical protein [Dysgonamonadaceae bacterium]
MFKEIINDFKEFRLWWFNYLFYRRHAIKLKLAVMLADIKQKAFNKRYFVVLIETPDKDKLVSINNNEFKIFKRRGWLPKKMSYLELEEYSFYQTSVGLNNKQSGEQREKAKKRYLKYARKCMR